MKCPKCNTDLPEGSLFCPECGTKLETKKKNNLLLVGIAAVLFVIGGGVAIFSGENSNDADQASLAVMADQESVESSTTKTETVKSATADNTDKQIVPNTAKQSVEDENKVDTKDAANQTTLTQKVYASNSSAAVKVEFGNYSGPSNGLGGIISVTRTYSLDLRKGDGRSLELQPGDQIQQTKFVDGDLKQGVWIHQGTRQFFTR